MKRIFLNLLGALAAFANLNPQLSTAFAQGTAFTYQGRLNDSGAPANGSYQFYFRLEDDNNVAIGYSIVTPPLEVSNGLFTVTLDFGPGAFSNANRRLHMEVRTNGIGNMFVVLSPPQPILPTPFAIFAEGADAAGIIGVVSNAFSAVNATNLSGPLLGDVTGTQGATVVSTVGGQSATNVASGVSAANAATSANIPGAIVKRDGSGSFGAGTVTLAGTLNLPATPATIFSGGATLLHSDAQDNFFTGRSAGNLTTTGAGNTANGVAALALNTSGNGNTALGYSALYFNANGDNNTAVGFTALDHNSSGSNNTANGSQALFYNTGGNNNTANGFKALYANTGGNYNTANGTSALQENTTGAGNTANGFGALVYSTEGSYNTANGLQVLSFNSTGSYNTADGVHALFYNTTGSNNTAVGNGALFNNTSGSANIALGNQAGYNHTTGSNNIAIGNSGVVGENRTIRIGTQGAQTNTFVAGIYGSAAGGGVPVGVDASGKLGTLSGRLDARIAITNAGAVTLSVPGSYYLTTNITVSAGDAITITANNVWLDLNGFTIFSTAPSAEGTAILLSGPRVNITILNGFIQGGVTNNAGTYEGPGFRSGITGEIGFPSIYALNVRVVGVSISGCLDKGIWLTIGSMVESCMVTTVGGNGIRADFVKSSEASSGYDAIYCLYASESAGGSADGYGVYANRSALNCRGYSGSGVGLRSETAVGCTGESNGEDTGLESYIAQNCMGQSYAGTGLSASVAIGCIGITSWGLYSLAAHMANSCHTLPWENYDVAYKYNMP